MNTMDYKTFVCEVSGKRLVHHIQVLDVGVPKRMLLVLQQSVIMGGCVYTVKYYPIFFVIVPNQFSFTRILLEISFLCNKH